MSQFRGAWDLPTSLRSSGVNNGVQLRSIVGGAFGARVASRKRGLCSNWSRQLLPRQPGAGSSGTAAAGGAERQRPPCRSEARRSVLRWSAQVRAVWEGQPSLCLDNSFALPTESTTPLPSLPSSKTLHRRPHWVNGGAETVCSGACTVVVGPTAHRRERSCFTVQAGDCVVHLRIPGTGQSAAT